MANRTIGESIRVQRIIKKLKQGELAELMGVKQSVISSWETGRTFPHILNCISLANTLGISLDELVGRENRQ